MRFLLILRSVVFLRNPYTFYPLINMKQRIHVFLVSLLLVASSVLQAQVFTNNTVAACNSWDSNNSWGSALSRPVAVSGLPTGGLSTAGTVLREVRVRLGNSTCRGNLSTYKLRVTNPQGVQVVIADNLVTTGTSIWVDMKFRDDIALERLKEYPSITVQATYFPHSIGYYALETDGSFNNFNTAADPNGNWLFEIIEGTTSEVSFERVDLVFGPAINVRDVTSCTSNNFCGGASCIYNGVFRGNNNGYSGADPQYPGATVNGCSWNGANNNSAWFSFIPTTTTAKITISGMLNSSTPTSSDMQPIVLKANGNCGVPTIVPTGGCPKDQTINNRSYSNDVTINPSPNTGGATTGSIYGNGISDNTEFILSGLVVGDTYYLYVDGNGGASSFFYIEVESGVSTPCDFCCTPITLSGPASICSGAAAVTIGRTGGTGTGTWSVSPSSAGTINSSGQFTPATGITADVIAEITYQEGECVKKVEVIVTKCTTFGSFATAAWLTTCTSNSFFNTTGTGEDLVDRFEKKDFNDTFLGTYVQNSGRLKLRGAEVKTFKNLSLANVCGATFFYRIYQTNGTPGAFSSFALPFFSNCNTGISEFEFGGGPCNAGDQKWQKVRSDAESPIDLTAFPPGNYTLQVYYEVQGDENSTTACDDKLVVDNAGRYYSATFSIQSTPSLTSTNPTTCNGTEGSITINGLAPSTEYTLSYSDDTTPVGPLTITSDANGQYVINGLNPGSYTNFTLVVNGCTINISNGVTLVNPVFTTTFDPIPAFCNGATAPVLPATSKEGFTGTWNPTTIDNQNSRTYTFTPTDGQCATVATLDVTVTNTITPTFDPIAPICQGATAPALPARSKEGISGTWNPTAIDNQANGTYTFTPDAGSCITTAVINVTVNPVVTPTFDFAAQLNICSGGTVPALPTRSVNLVDGTWNPTTVSTTQNGTYVFTPTQGACTNTFTLNVNVTTLNLQTSKTDNTVCNGSGGGGGGCVSRGTGVVINEVRHYPVGGAATQGITGTRREYIELYNPTCEPIDISCYILGSSCQNPNTPSADSDFGIMLPTGVILQPKAHYVIGTSALSSDPNTVDFKTDLNPSRVCSNEPSPVMTNSDGWVALYKRDGTPVDAIYWTVAAGQQNKITSDEDFNDNPCTPAPAEGCNTTGVILRSATEIYNFNAALISYVGITAPNPVQPTGKTFSRIPDGGAWQSEVESSIEGSNCNGGQCDVPTSGGSTCNGAASVSVTGGSGTYTYEWKDAQDKVVSTTSNAAELCPGQYCVKVTDPQSNCSATSCVTVEDKSQTITPEFDSYGPYCQGAILTQATLPETSKNGIKGTWSPASISTATAGDFEFTFTPDQGQCASVLKITVKINPSVTPEFDPIAPICAGTQAPSLPGSSKNGINGTWNPNTINNQEGGTYTFTPEVGQCAEPVTINVTVNPLPSVVVRTDTTVYHNAVVPATNFLILPEGANVTWSNSLPSIGLAAAGTGNVQSFTAINSGQNDVTATITVIPSANNCQGPAQSYKITVRSLSREVYVPNVFSPNGDGKNDQLKVYGNYIARLEMRIFNQWGEQVMYINNQSQGWDGTHRGKPQPVGVYVYVLKAVLTDGTEVNKKGSITLIR